MNPEPSTVNPEPQRNYSNTFQGDSRGGGSEEKTLSAAEGSHTRVCWIPTLIKSLKPESFNPKHRVLHPKPIIVDPKP